jgi:hypothetical protein
MKKHLQHYGYYTGRNVAISKYGYEPKKGSKGDDSDESDTESENDSETADQSNQKFHFISIGNK